MPSPSYGSSRSEPRPELGAHPAHASELDAIYREHAADLSRWIRRLAGDEQETADLVHEVFLVAQRRFARFRGESSLRTWLYAIAVRVVGARRRKQRLRRLLWLEHGPAADAGEPLDPATPESVVRKRQAARMVYGALDRLSERDRTLIVSYELEALSVREIADILGISDNAVAVALHRARARFRAAFVELFGAGGEA